MRSLAIALSFLMAMASSSQSVEHKVIYGPDDRLDIPQVSDTAVLAVAASTCALVSSIDVVDNGNGTFSAVFGNFNLCPTEPFSNQPVWSFCSGFLVGDDLIATAGHCINESNVTNVRFVFGYDIISGDTAVSLYDSSQVYSGVSLVGRVLDNTNGEDWALVRVDRTVNAPGAMPLAIRRSGAVAVGDPVGVIGHPSGLPKKVGFGATTEVKDISNEAFFDANVDTYGGNSGSPIFNQSTLEVEGILVRGNTDYISQGNCIVSNVLSDELGINGAFEDCTRVSTFATLVPTLTPIFGDIDGDGWLGAADVQNVINAALSLPVGFMTDLDNDGDTNAVDVQNIINLLLAR